MQFAAPAKEAAFSTYKRFAGNRTRYPLVKSNFAYSKSFPFFIFFIWKAS